MFRVGRAAQTPAPGISFLAKAGAGTGFRGPIPGPGRGQGNQPAPRPSRQAKEAARQKRVAVIPSIPRHPQASVLRSEILRSCVPPGSCRSSPPSGLSKTYGGWPTTAGLGGPCAISSPVRGAVDVQAVSDVKLHDRARRESLAFLGPTGARQDHQNSMNLSAA